MDFDTLRHRAELFLQNLNRALYLRHTGQLADIPQRQLYEQPGIFTAEIIASVREQLALAPQTEQLRMRSTLAFLIEGYLRLNAVDLDEAMAKRYDLQTGSGAWARYDALNAPAIGQTVDANLSEQLLELYQQRWQSLEEGLRRIDFGLHDYIELIAGEDPATLAEQAAVELARTETDYLAGLASFRRRAGDVAERHKLESALSASSFAASFPQAELVPTIEDTLYHLGIDVTRQPNLAIEINRSLQPCSAMAFPIRVPEEIYLVVSPDGGLNAYEQLLRVVGMIMPKLLLSPKAPWAFRRLANHGVAEAYGELCVGLLGNSTWLVDLLNFDEVVGDFIDYYRFRRLYHFRRAAARLINLVERASGRDSYTDVFARALGVSHRPSSLWLDMGWQRRAIPTWQGLWQGQQLEQTLLWQYGPNWYRDQGATERLRELMASDVVGLPQLLLEGSDRSD